jgi:dUTP pyrophosphatase
MIEVKICIDQSCIDLPLPEYKSQGASGMDLMAAVTEDVVLKPGQFELIPTGIRLQLPEGYEGQVRPRSGLAARYGITVLNTPGTIDSDYRGEIKLIIINLGKQPYTIKRGDRLAQLVVCKYERVCLKKVKDLDDTSRGQGGFGHTGI